jgi:hypothetical protein
LSRSGEIAGGQVTGSDDPDQFIAFAQWQQSDSCSLDQLIVVKRAVPPGDAVERLERCAERRRKSGKISFFRYCIAADQDTIST